MANHPKRVKARHAHQLVSSYAFAHTQAFCRTAVPETATGVLLFFGYLCSIMHVVVAVNTI
jgi:hypothetical protein